MRVLWSFVAVVLAAAPMFAASVGDTAQTNNAIVGNNEAREKLARRKSDGVAKRKDCKKAFEKCVKHHMDYFENFQKHYLTGRTVRISDEGLDGMCRNKMSFHACVDQLWWTCGKDIHWGEERSNYYTSLLDFICQGQGREAFLLLDGMSCNTKLNIGRYTVDCQKTSLIRYHTAKKGRVNHLPQYGGSLLCRHVQEYRSCHRRALEKSCGNHLADFIYQLDNLINKDRYAHEMKLYRC
ncbi:unnamed protein product [Lymnaea stagnalis]|uniref:Uncharacterized protein n=1 Tax=Lymnaea stagnalis TaxID=6523 RepID=A0AAV2IKR1_LYMST